MVRKCCVRWPDLMASRYSIRRTTTSGPASLPHISICTASMIIVSFLLFFYLLNTCCLSLYLSLATSAAVTRSQLIDFYLPSCVQLLLLPSAQMQVNITSKSSCKYLYVIRLYLLLGECVSTESSPLLNGYARSAKRICYINIYWKQEELKWRKTAQILRSVFHANVVSSYTSLQSSA